jgi:hypothetical protein
MLTHVHKVKHLVVDTFDKGGEVGEKKVLFCSDRTLVTN